MIIFLVNEVVCFLREILLGCCFKRCFTRASVNDDANFILKYFGANLRCFLLFGKCFLVLNCLDALCNMLVCR